MKDHSYKLRDKKPAYFFLTLLTLFFVNNLLGQSNHFRFSHLSIENGLADNFVSDMHMDKNGFLWISTHKGLSRYDGYSFKNFFYVEGDSSSLFGSAVKSIEEDAQGYLWIGTIGGGLNRFDPSTEVFQKFSYVIENPYSEGQDVTSIIIDKSENIWVGTFSCGFQHFDKKSQKFTRYNIEENLKTGGERFAKNTVHTLLQDIENPDRLWVGSSQGLYVFNKKNKSLNKVPLLINNKKDTSTTILSLFMENPSELWVGTWRLGLGHLDIKNEQWAFEIPDQKEYLKNNHLSNIINDIERKSEDELWVCSQDQGLLVFNETNKEFKKISFDPTDSYSIKSDKVNGIYKDIQNRYWMFNFQKGISLLDPSNQSFQYHDLNQKEICSEIEAHVFDISTDSKTDQIYITTIGCEALFIFDKNKKLLRSLSITPDKPASIDGYHVVVDDNQTVWLAGGTGDQDSPSLLTYNSSTNSLEPFNHPDLSKIPIHSYKLTEIIEGEKGVIWIATILGGLIKIDTRTNTIDQFISPNPKSGSIDIRTELTDIKRSKDGKIWIATLQEGVFAFDPTTEQFDHYSTSDTAKKGLRGKRIITIEEDRHGRIWAGLSATGIQVIDPKKEDWLVASFQSKNGLPNEEIWKINKDLEGNIWLATQYGLCRYDEVNNDFIQYIAMDGIKDPVLYQKGFFVAPDKNVFFGQVNEFCTFSPQQMSKNQPTPKIAFTSFKVLEKDYPLEKELNYIDKINLRYDQNFFSISFSALSFTNPQKNKYAFKLEGYDTDWINHNGDRNFASYNKVPPGSYTFLVKAANHENVWNDTPITLDIEIKPPFWKTYWAYLIYAALGVLLFIGFNNFQLKRKLAQQEAERLKELDEAKTKLFNNITHELRTPLTVVLGSVDRARRLNRSLTEPELKLIKQNGEQLLKLINQVLDLGKLDAGAMSLNYQWDDIISFLNYVIYSFDTLADEKNIHLNVETYPIKCRAFFDKEKLTIILSNLLSNAIKFTPEAGKINVYVKIKENQSPNYTNQKNHEKGMLKTLIIEVRDTGIGIEKSKAPYIFDRFYQADIDRIQTDDSLSHTKGTGIGLSLTKELVTLLGGKISVISELGEGTRFQTELPLLTQQDSPKSKPVAIDDSLPVVLFVEDNPSLVQYVSIGLTPHFQVLIENNGKDGLERALEIIPDIIISDIVMPEMDGLTLCQNLKENHLTSHIPVILLTAKIGQESKLAGLQKGADAYLTKPFDERELLIRIQNLLTQRDSLKTFYLQNAGLSELPHSKTNKVLANESEKENAFVKQVRNVMLDHLDNQDFNISLLGKAIGLSHTQLHRKLVALTGLPPVKLMNTLRLNKAKELLVATQLSISEIAYQTGFSDPSYFSKNFKSNSGHSPKEYRKIMK